MNNNNKSQQMTTGNIMRTLISFSIPLMAGQFFQQLYTTTDSVIIGNFVGSDGLAAIGASNQIVNLLIGFFLGLTTGMGVVIAQGAGARDNERVSISVHTSLFICIVGGILVTLVGIIASPWLLGKMDTPPQILKEAVIYLQIYFAGSIFNIIYNMAASILRGVGDSKRPFMILLIASVTNIVLDCIFVIIFHWGIVGVAIATLIAQIISAILALYLLCQTKENYRVEWRKVRYNSKYFKIIMHLGLPSGLQTTIITLSNMIVQTNINSFGTIAMAGFVLYWRADNFLMIPIQTLILTATTFSGQNAGAGKIDRIKTGLKKCLLLSGGYSIIIALFMYFCSEMIFRIFTQESAVIEYGIMQSRIIVMGYLFLSSLQIILGFIRGLGETFMPMILSILNMCVLRVIYLSTFVAVHHEMRYVYWGYTLTWASTFFCVLIYYFARRQALFRKYT